MCIAELSAGRLPAVTAVGAWSAVADGHGPAEFSNLGSGLALFAPGERMVAAEVSVDDDRGRLGYAGGTSAATALVSGSVSTLVPSFGWSPLEAEAALVDHALPVEGRSAGRLDVRRSITRAGPEPR